MSTTPNYRDFFDGDDESLPEYWGDKAAGVIFISKDTGRILLAHRSERVDYEPGTWGTWGGKVEVDESPKDAASREVEEETGYDGVAKIHPLYVYKDGSFEYHNFLVIVPFEFTPQLNWENQGSKWVEYGEWPSPLHFGMEELIKNAGTKIQRVVELIKKRKLTEIDAPPVIHQSTMTFSKDFIQYIKSVENAGKVGFKNGKWYPHESPEGGWPTIGYGHKIKNQTELDRLRKGISEGEVERLLVSDLQLARSQVKSDIKQMFDVQVLLDQTQEEILIDYAFNLGNIRGYPKFVKAVLNKDWETAKKEYKRTFKDASGKRQELGRNKAFASRYLKENTDEVKNISTGLIDVGVYGYKLTSPYSSITYGYEPSSKVFYLYMVRTPREQDLNKGHSKSLLEKFMQMIQKQGGALDQGSYTTSGMAFVKHVIERLAKQYNVRLVRGPSHLG